MTTLASEIITNIETNLPSGYHSSELTSTVKLRFMNDIQRQVCRANNFAWMKQEVTRDTADSTQTYSLPTAGDSNWTRAAGGGGSDVLLFKRDISLELINSESYRVPLEKVHKQILEDKRKLAKESGDGIPEYYDVDQELIWLYKIPDHAVNASSAWSMNFEFYGYLTDLASGGNNVLTNKHHLVLEYGVTARCFVYGRDFAAANEWREMSQQIFSQMLDEDADLQLGGQEEGFYPAVGQGVGGGDPYRGFMQGTSWYT